ncbi:MAG: cadherin domain-containing protein, partial [Anaerolineales bacterium]|nr:cadherin domain-containing protein [Anaerolineales bacterium]
MKTSLSFIRNRHISLALAIIVALLASTNVLAAVGSPDLTSGSNADSAPINPIANSLATFTKLNLIPNIETIGVVVSGANLPVKADLMYRQSSETIWHSGHPLMRIDDGRLIGSLFGLSPATSYDIKVLDGSAEISGSITTQPDGLQFTPSVIVHVNDDAPSGGDGSAAAPFKTIQEGVNHAGPGTQVLVADGIYHEAVTFNASGSEGNWIQVKAEGSGVILDGSENLSGNIWKPHSSKARVWSTKIGRSIAYLARDQKRFYNYDNLQGLLQGRGHGNVAMNEGWYIDAGKLYVRSQDKPSGHTWQVPYLNHAFDAAGRDWIWIEGFEIRFYGTTTGGCGICTINASHVVIRRNSIHNLQLGIFIQWTGGENQGNDTRIEYNQIYDPPVNEWPWKAVKGSSMEGTAIVVRGHIGAIVRGNELHHFFNGIYTGSSGALENSALAFDADIYNNHIHHISDDALEPEGACINQRFRNNTVDTAYVGISLAPITQGPTWVLRSSFTNFTGRGVKWDGRSDGIVLIYHNTSWTNAKDVNGMDLISPIHNAILRNNIFQVGGYGFQAVRTGSTGNDWNNDNWYTTRALASGHFKWENVLYNNTAKLCKATGLECNGYEDPPGLTNPSDGDFTLLPLSPNIDRGIIIPGINDNFTGNAPDIGAYESTFEIDTAPRVLSSVRADSNPTDAASVNFIVTFSESITGVDIAPPFNDFALISSPGITGASITNVIPVLGATYTVNVNTGSGNGTLRLDIVDDDSILDAANNPLGGAGAGNGNFNTGEVYTINTPPISTMSETFRSIGVYDGWALESNANSNQGGSMDSTAKIFNLGDDAKDRQYRSILSFNTASIPDNAIITSAHVKIKRQGLTGVNPFTTHGDLLLDVRKGAFSNNINLKLDDFAAAGDSGTNQDKFSALTFSWYAANLSNANLGFINKYGATQFRLLFSKDDNDDLHADYMRFFSGNASDSDQPQLIVTYYLDSGAVNSDKQSISRMSVVNEKPLITSNGGLGTASVNTTENTMAITTVIATNVDLPAQPLTYSIVGGADAPLFSINSSTGELTFINAPDYELPMDAGGDNIYNLTVQVSDGTLIAAQDVAVTVTAINDNNPVITSNGVLSIPENTTAVITVTATDADLPAQLLAYSISGGADSTLFNINSSTGELTFITAPDYEFSMDAGTDNIYNVTVQASDGTLIATQDIAVTVTAINDNNPVITSNGVLSIAENTMAATIVTATDADLPAQLLAYSISGGADSNLFSINSFSGELTFITAPDYEFSMDAGTDNIYNVTVQASDGTLIATQDIAVTVTAI